MSLFETCLHLYIYIFLSRHKADHKGKRLYFFHDHDDDSMKRREIVGE